MIVTESILPVSSIRLIAGLGNPGREYENTRHNAGFMILDRLAVKLGANFSSERKFEGHLARAGSLFLLKPQTYMNLSGRSVAAVCQFYRIEPAEVLVVYDDVALPEGRLRLRANGSAGGHNGMRSIIACLGTDQFPRLRFGVGASEGKGLVGHVLGAFDPGGREALDKSLENAAEAASICALRGLAAAMNHFNPQEKPTPKPAAPRTPKSADGPTPTPKHEA
jgi:PTH1 family peptidyl-tRNA hydrolase